MEEKKILEVMRRVIDEAMKRLEEEEKTQAEEQKEQQTTPLIKPIPKIEIKR